MSSDRDQPLVARNFRVRFTLLGPRGGVGGERELAFSQVALPPFRLDGRDVRDIGRDPRVHDEGAAPASRNLVLRRGHTGSQELFELWRAERDRERYRVRSVTVQLLDHAHRAVTSWRFTGCHVVGLDYSMLDALDPGVLTECLEVSFKQVEQHDDRI